MARKTSLERAIQKDAKKSAKRLALTPKTKEPQRGRQRFTTLADAEKLIGVAPNRPTGLTDVERLARKIAQIEKL